MCVILKNELFFFVVVLFKSNLKTKNCFGVSHHREKKKKQRMRKRADQQKYRMEKVKCRKKNQQTVFLKLVGKEGRVCTVTSFESTYLKTKNNNSNTQVP